MGLHPNTPSGLSSAMLWDSISIPNGNSLPLSNGIPPQYTMGSLYHYAMGLHPNTPWESFSYYAMGLHLNTPWGLSQWNPNRVDLEVIAMKGLRHTPIALPLHAPFLLSLSFIQNICYKTQESGIHGLEPFITCLIGWI